MFDSKSVFVLILYPAWLFDTQALLNAQLITLFKINSIIQVIPSKKAYHVCFSGRSWRRKNDKSNGKCCTYVVPI